MESSECRPHESGKSMKQGVPESRRLHRRQLTRRGLSIASERKKDTPRRDLGSISAIEVMQLIVQRSIQISGEAGDLQKGIIEIKIEVNLVQIKSRQQQIAG